MSEPASPDFSSPLSPPPALWGWGGLLLVASFLSWGTIQASPFSGFPFPFPNQSLENTPFGNTPFGGMTLSLTAWNSHLTLLGLKLPNWLPVVAGLGGVGAMYLRSGGAGSAGKWPRLLLVYALVHTALFGAVLLGSGRGSIGIGILAAIVALGGLIKTVWKA